MTERYSIRKQDDDVIAIIPVKNITMMDDGTKCFVNLGNNKELMWRIMKIMGNPNKTIILGNDWMDEN